ncbi:MAG: hypothetical protein AB8E82_15250 [Aureispira sp.]
MRISILCCFLWLLFCGCGGEGAPASIAEEATKHDIAPSEAPSVEEEENLEDDLSKIRPFGKILIGTIDNQYEIEISLHMEDGVLLDEGCTPLTGTYQYFSTNKLMEIKGKICKKEQMLYLDRIKNGKAVEHFEGRIEGNFASVKGTWTKDDNVFDFEIKNLSLLSSYPLFLEAVTHAEENMPNMAVEEIGIDDEGVYFVDPIAFSYDFYPDNFSYSTYYESTAINADYTATAFFQRSNLLGDYFSASSVTQWVEDFPEGKDAEAKPIESKETRYAVYIYQEDTIVNIFVSNPKDASTGIYATEKKGKLVLVNAATNEEEEI